jgi:hypothetical protein
MAVASSGGDPGRMTRIRRGAVWFVISLLVFMLVATLVLDQAT